MTVIAIDNFFLKLLAPFKIFFPSSEKKHKHPLTIKEVFYEALDFNWDELN